MGQADVLKWLKDRPGWHTNTEMAQAMDKDLSGLQRLLVKLVRNKEIKVERPGKNGKFRYMYINYEETNSSLGLAAQESQNYKAAG